MKQTNQKANLSHIKIEHDPTFQMNSLGGYVSLEIIDTITMLFIEKTLPTLATSPSQLPYTVKWIDVKDFLETTANNKNETDSEFIKNWIENFQKNNSFNEYSNLYISSMFARYIPPTTITSGN